MLSIKSIATFPDDSSPPPRSPLALSLVQLPTWPFLQPTLRPSWSASRRRTRPRDLGTNWPQSLLEISRRDV